MTPPGLRRSLGAGQLSLLAIGGAIGTGLFLGSGVAISIAGPAVLLSYAIGGAVAYALMLALAEMTVAHPEAGSFGWLAERYLGARAGFLTRASYWAANVLAVGTEVTAIAVYMRFWWPHVPGWVWILGFPGALVAVNLASVRVFGAVESAFSLCKIAAILGFLALGTVFLLRAPATLHAGWPNYVSHGGFAPHGVGGVWIGAVVAIFSYLGIEVIAVAAGEARDPATALRRALRATLARLVLFYLATLALTLAIVPWTRASAGTSPFVTVMQATGIPGAAAILNAVILVAALSAMNSQIYAATRMLLSLAHAGQVPVRLARIDKRGVPRTALLASCAGIAIAAVVYACRPDGAFAAMFAISIFGAMFAWGMIFATHLRFRAATGGGGARSGASLLGAITMAAMLASTPFSPPLRPTLPFGLPFLAALLLLHRWSAGRVARSRPPYG